MRKSSSSSNAIRFSRFGLQARQDFYLEDGTAFTNHGSYGTVPRPVMQERFRLLQEMELNPDRWFRKTLRERYDENVRVLADFVGADPNNLVFVTNATTAVNTVVKNLVLGPEDIILLNSHTYGACAKAIDCAVRKCGADMLSLDIILPIRSEDQLIDQVVEACKRNVGIRLAIIDHISSPSAIVFPVARLAQELHKLGVWLLVDGAHAPGQLELNLEELGADFYTGNLHKWCFAPRGSAFLWVNPRHRDSVQPLVTSHNYQKDLADQFFFQGTADHTPYLCVSAALDFYKSYGGMTEIREYTTELLDWAQQMLCHALGTSVLPIPSSLQAPNMRVLKLPKLKHYAVNSVDSEKMMTHLADGSGCVAVVVCFSGFLWLRISANIYNTKEDYLALKSIIMEHVDV